MKEILRDRKLVVTALFTTLIFIGMNFAHPVTPTFLDDANISSKYFSIFFSSMAVMLLLFSPFWGTRGDYLGRKRVIAMGIAGYGIGQLVFGMNDNVAIIIIGRLISGFFAASIFTNLVATYSELSDMRMRATYVAIYTSLNIFAGAIGYLIGGNLGTIIGAANTIIVQGFVDIGLGILVLCFFPKTVTTVNKRKSFKENIVLLRSIHGKIIFLLLATTFFVMAQNNNAKFLDLYLTDYGFATDKIGSFVFITGLVSGFVALIFVPFLARRFRDLRILISVSVLVIITMLSFILIPNLKVSLFGPYLFYIALQTTYFAVDQTFLSKQVTQDYGAVLGIRESFRSLGLALGPLIGGAVFYKAQTELIFIFNTCLFIISFILLSIFIANKEKR